MDEPLNCVPNQSRNFGRAKGNANGVHFFQENSVIINGIWN